MLTFRREVSDEGIIIAGIYDNSDVVNGRVGSEIGQERHWPDDSEATELAVLTIR